MKATTGRSTTTRSYCHHYAPQACDIVSWIMIRKLFSSTTIAVVTVETTYSPFFSLSGLWKTLHLYLGSIERQKKIGALGFNCNWWIRECAINMTTLVRKEKRRFCPTFSHVGQDYNFCYHEDLHIRLCHARANNTAAIVLLKTLTLAYFSLVICQY